MIEIVRFETDRLPILLGCVGNFCQHFNSSHFDSLLKLIPHSAASSRVQFILEVCKNADFKKLENKPSFTLSRLLPGYIPFNPNHPVVRLTQDIKLHIKTIQDLLFIIELVAEQDRIAFLKLFSHNELLGLIKTIEDWEALTKVCDTIA